MCHLKTSVVTAGIASDVCGLEQAIPFPVREKKLPLVQSDQTVTVSHPALLFGGAGVRRSEREADHSTSSRAKVK